MVRVGDNGKEKYAKNNESGKDIRAGGHKDR